MKPKISIKNKAKAAQLFGLRAFTVVNDKLTPKAEAIEKETRDRAKRRKEFDKLHKKGGKRTEIQEVKYQTLKAEFKPETPETQGEAQGENPSESANLEE